MSYFAKIDENNNVIDIISADKSFILSGLVGDKNDWVECARDGSIRYNMPGVGYTYDPSLDAFIPPKPYNSWVLNDNCLWTAPTPIPSDGNYRWDEETTSWVVAPTSD
jgi:hypothetical protein